MTKPKPKTTKAADGWRVQRPGYGFTGPEVLGPFPSQSAALASLQVGTGAAGPMVERTETPDRQWMRAEIWPTVIR